ncbi:hypothetical protein HK099_001381 [Clydaea vesicula]|uniref:Uncharacterized protein n=1 Tax=Clydaea vesicula TaxID=447962 RepID=A0AAD5XX10_9FUNG|nr:hypothetical protein HK099_001381 [Clydaea vesicula]
MTWITCYRLVHHLQQKSEETLPIHQSLIQIYNQLYTLKSCLSELNKWKVVLTERELIPYQMKLAKLDNKRVDGKFEVNGTIPEGQGELHGLLNECYEGLNQLKLRFIEKLEHEEEDDDDDF